MLSVAMLSESAGCAILADVFRKRGYAVAENVDFHEGDVAFNIDGWDARRRVGFEYRTTESADKKDLTDDELIALAKRMELGELFIFVIDDEGADDDDELREYAERFLDEVARRRGNA
jgi:hypothetical protein